MTQLTLDSLFAEAQEAKQWTVKDLQVKKLRDADVNSSTPVSFFTVGIIDKNGKRTVIGELSQWKEGQEGYFSNHPSNWGWIVTKIKTVEYHTRLYNSFVVDETTKNRKAFQVEDEPPVRVRKQAIQWFVDQLNEGKVNLSGLCL